MDEHQTISVDFGKPMPVFPLAQVVLMPHQALPVHIFEARYRLMTAEALRGARQIAVAVYADNSWRDDETPGPPIRPAVCVSQIVQHHRLDDGRFNLLLQGVCRATITSEVPPSEHGKPYRMAHLRPVGVDIDEDIMAAERSRLSALFNATSLRDLREAKAIAGHLADEEVPTSAILELVAFCVLPDPEMRYRLLAEGDALRRSAIIRTQLDAIRNLLDRAAPQRMAQATLPKGVFNN